MARAAAFVRGGPAPFVRGGAAPFVKEGELAGVATALTCSLEGGRPALHQPTGAHAPIRLRTNAPCGAWRGQTWTRASEGRHPAFPARRQARPLHAQRGQRAGARREGRMPSLRGARLILTGVMLLRGPWLLWREGVPSSRHLPTGPFLSLPPRPVPRRRPPSCHSPLAGESRKSVLAFSRRGGRRRTSEREAANGRRPPSEKSRGRLFSTPPRGGVTGRGPYKGSAPLRAWRPLGARASCPRMRRQAHWFEGGLGACAPCGASEGKMRSPPRARHHCKGR